MPYDNGLESMESNPLTGRQVVDANFEDLDRWRIFSDDNSVAIPDPSTPAGALKIDVDGASQGQIACSDGNDWLEVVRVALHPLDASADNVTFTLPDPADPVAAGAAGAPWKFKRLDGTGNTVTVEVDDSGSQSIDGAADQALPSQNSFLVLAHDGVADWFVVAEG